jgi:hypothetical protein
MVVSCSSGKVGRFTILAVPRGRTEGIEREQNHAVAFDTGTATGVTVSSLTQPGLLVEWTCRCPLLFDTILLSGRITMSELKIFFMRTSIIRLVMVCPVLISCTSESATTGGVVEVAEADSPTSDLVDLPDAVVRGDVPVQVVEVVDESQFSDVAVVDVRADGADWAETPGFSCGDGTAIATCLDLLFCVAECTQAMKGFSSPCTDLCKDCATAAAVSAYDAVGFCFTGLGPRMLCGAHGATTSICWETACPSAHHACLSSGEEITCDSVLECIKPRCHDSSTMELTSIIWKCKYMSSLTSFVLWLDLEYCIFQLGPSNICDAITSGDPFEGPCASKYDACVADK